MQKSDVKSSTVAGILGVFLGAFGGHDWYLGNTKKAITHVALCVGGIILLMIGVILDNLSQNVPVINALFICVIIMSYIIIVGNAVWGMIEGIIIIAQGDAGLEAKGYKVADAGMPLTMANPNENPEKAEVAPVATIASEGNVAVAPMEEKLATVGAAETPVASAPVNMPGAKPDGAVAAGTGTAETSFPAGAPAETTAAVNATPEVKSEPGVVRPEGVVTANEPEVTLVERSTLPKAASDEEIAKAADVAVNQAQGAMGEKK